MAYEAPDSPTFLLSHFKAFILPSRGTTVLKTHNYLAPVVDVTYVVHKCTLK